jgi:hypothetical protein
VHHESAVLLHRYREKLNTLDVSYRPPMPNLCSFGDKHADKLENINPINVGSEIVSQQGSRRYLISDAV